MSKVLITGGAGYVGSILTPKLLAEDHKVVAYDSMIFGPNGLPIDKDLEIIDGDIRDTIQLGKALAGVNTVIHLASISNDPSFELDPQLSRSINYDSFEPLILACKTAGVSRFIYASTSSVYGVSDAAEVTEEHPLVPLTDYNKYKGLSEPILLKHQAADFTTVIIRPATVCGYSPRMRFDLTVNILTNQAVNEQLIKVFGGTQKRPNIHIEDITDLYVKLLDFPAELIAGEIFNAGYQNHTVAEIAAIVRNVVEDEMPGNGPVHITTTHSDDLRSYHVSSRKISDQLGYTPQRSVEDAVRDICTAFKQNRLPNSLTDERYINVKTLKSLDSR